MAAGESVVAAPESPPSPELPLLAAAAPSRFAAAPPALVFRGAAAATDPWAAAVAYPPASARAPAARMCGGWVRFAALDDACLGRSFPWTELTSQ